jgi:hypothetical protein
MAPPNKHQRAISTTITRTGRRQEIKSYPFVAALELALALARDDVVVGALLELSGVGVPMGAALAVLAVLALVLRHHVVLGHGGGWVWAAAEEGGGKSKPTEPFRSGL